MMWAGLVSAFTVEAVLDKEKAVSDVRTQAGTENHGKGSQFSSVVTLEGPVWFIYATNARSAVGAAD